MSVRWSLKPTNIQGGNWRLLWRMSFIGEHDNYYGDEKHIFDMSNLQPLSLLTDEVLLR